MKQYKNTENNIIYDVEEDENGTKEWHLNSNRHREYGPAVEYTNGTKYWYKNGKCHREDGPAIEFNNGNKYWYKNDKFHREDGPAVEWANGYKEYWYNGHQLTNMGSDKEFKRYIKLLSIS